MRWIDDNQFQHHDHHNRASWHDNDFYDQHHDLLRKLRAPLRAAEMEQ